MRALTVSLGLMVAATAPTAAQVTVEAYGGLGFNGVDVAAWAGTQPYDWDETMAEVYGQVFFFEAGGVSLGAELGYSHLLWYEITYLGSYIGYDVEANRVMGVARTDFTSFVFGEVAVGYYLFDGFTDMAASAALGGHIPLSGPWTIPVKLRATTILDTDANMTPIGLSIGVAYDTGGGVE